MRAQPKVKHPYVGDIRWAFLRWADIESARRPGYTYLRRLRVIQTPWWAIYLHWIFEPDEDREPHDHPCNFWSLIVWGGYTEDVYSQRRGPLDWLIRRSDRRMGSVHKMPINKAHQITRIHEKRSTVTLCLFGKRQRRWGFWTDQGWVPYTEYYR